MTRDSTPARRRTSSWFPAVSETTGVVLASVEDSICSTQLLRFQRDSESRERYGRNRRGTFKCGGEEPKPEPRHPNPAFNVSTCARSAGTDGGRRRRMTSSTGADRTRCRRRFCPATTFVSSSRVDRARASPGRNGVPRTPLLRIRAHDRNRFAPASNERHPQS